MCLEGLKKSLRRFLKMVYDSNLGYDREIVLKVDQLLQYMIIDQDPRLEEILVVIDFKLDELMGSKLPKLPLNPENPCSVYGAECADFTRRKGLAFNKVYRYLEVHYPDLYEKMHRAL